MNEGINSIMVFTVKLYLEKLFKYKIISSLTKNFSDHRAQQWLIEIIIQIQDLPGLNSVLAEYKRPQGMWMKMKSLNNYTSVRQQMLILFKRKYLLHLLLRNYC